MAEACGETSSPPGLMLVAQLLKAFEDVPFGWESLADPTSEGYFSPHRFFRFRVMCQKVIAHKMFDHVVLVFIFLNCITIALERPDIDPHSTVST